MEKIYDVNYFIEKFESIPEEKWITSWLNRNGKSCALGHCGVISQDGEMGGVKKYTFSKEGNALVEILSPLSTGKIQYVVNMINDGAINPHLLNNPKQRILAALYDIRAMQNKEPLVKECDASKADSSTEVGNIKTIIKYVAVPTTIQESLPETILS